MDSSAPPPPPNPQGDTLPKAAAAAATATTSSDDVAMEAAPTVPEEEPLPEDIINASPEDIMTRVRLIDNDLKVSASRPRHPPRIAGRGTQSYRATVEGLQQGLGTLALLGFISYTCCSSTAVIPRLRVRLALRALAEAISLLVACTTAEHHPTTLLAGDAIREYATQPRTIKDDGTNQGQHREDQKQQATPLPRR